jgi:hypothetical protein
MARNAFSTSSCAETPLKKNRKKNLKFGRKIESFEIRSKQPKFESFEIRSKHPKFEIKLKGEKLIED